MFASTSCFKNVAKLQILQEIDKVMTVSKSNKNQQQIQIDQQKTTKTKKPKVGFVFRIPKGIAGHLIGKGAQEIKNLMQKVQTRTLLSFMI